MRIMMLRLETLQRHVSEITLALKLGHNSASILTVQRVILLPFPAAALEITHVRMHMVIPCWKKRMQRALKKTVALLQVV